MWPESSQTGGLVRAALFRSDTTIGDQGSDESTAVIQSSTSPRKRAHPACHDRRFIGHERIELLLRIGETGSITRAAKLVGMPYKKAWEVIDSMNRLSSRPLVLRRVGGNSGGGTELTDAGRRLIELYQEAEREHRLFLDRLAGRIDDVQHLYEVLEC